jgi:hypothetical protein
LDFTVTVFVADESPPQAARDAAATNGTAANDAVSRTARSLTTLDGERRRP